MKINSSDNVNNLFKKDKEIAAAYVALKPIMDSVISNLKVYHPF